MIEARDSAATATTGGNYNCSRAEYNYRTGLITKKQYRAMTSWIRYGGQRRRVCEAIEIATRECGDEAEAARHIARIFAQKAGRRHELGREALSSMATAIVLAVFAVGMSLGSYLVAAERGGRTYLVFWGAGAFAAYMLLRSVYLFTHFVVSRR